MFGKGDRVLGTMVQYRGKRMKCVSVSCDSYGLATHANLKDGKETHSIPIGKIKVREQWYVGK